MLGVEDVRYWVMGVEWWVLMITFHPTLSYLPPLLSEGLGEAFSLPLRGGSGWG